MFDPKRRAFTLAAAAAALGAPAFAQQRAGLRLLVGFPPGGPADVLARALADRMKGQFASVIVENRPGAGGRIAAEALRNAAPDGTTLLISPASAVTLAPHLYKSVRYELERDFLPLAPIARLDIGLYAGSATPDRLHSLADVIKWLQDNPGRRSCGIPGVGSTPHLAAMMLGQQARLDLQPVPYQGDAPGFAALMAGETPIYAGSLAGGIELVRAGKIRLLALSGSERSSILPDVPTLTQAGYPVVVEDRHSVFAPKLSTGVAASLHQALTQAMDSREFSDLLQRMSLQRASSSADFPTLLRNESARWKQAVKTLNISLDG